MKKKITIEEFIKKAREIHGDKYDYSKVEYIDSQTKICVICPFHGEFRVTPNNHIRYRGCPKCKSAKLRNSFLKSTECFIKEAQAIHGDKYDYSKVEYNGANNHVTIICPIHGEFTQTPHVHLMGCGCKECGKIINANKQRITFEEFVKRAREIHGDKYFYPVQTFETQHDKIKIICPIHGEFQQQMYTHLQGNGCGKCSKHIKKNTELFIEEAQSVHGNKYDYSKVEYKTVKDKVCIICPIHGEFWQTPDTHLRSKGCAKCSAEELQRQFCLGNSEFIKRSQIIHGNKYDYSKVDYINNTTKVCIICPIHGEFWQIPAKHLIGRGCSKCKESHLERDIRLFLEQYNINYSYQHKFDWLGRQSLDFYLEDYNIGIECQGSQHFYVRPTSSIFTTTDIEQIQQRDKKKAQLCEENGVKLLYYSNLGIEYPYEVFEDKEKLLEEIKKYSQKNLEV